MASSISDVTAGRYARALLDVASARNVVEICPDDLAKFRTAILAATNDFELFDNPTVPVCAAMALVSKLGAALDLDKTSVAFLSLLASRRRLGGLESILKKYRAHQDSLAGRTHGTIRSAGPVSDTQVTRIAESIGREIGRQLTLDREIDDSLLGGLQVTVGDMVYDLSTRTYLNSLRNRLLQNR